MSLQDVIFVKVRFIDCVIQSSVIQHLENKVGIDTIYSVLRIDDLFDCLWLWF